VQTYGEAESERRSGVDVAGLAAAVLDLLGAVAAETSEPAAGPSLLLPWGLTLAMVRHHAGPVELLAALLAARSAVLGSSGLDARSEPVPLPVPDAVIAATNTGRYLVGLVRRAAQVGGAAPQAVAAAAQGALAG